MTLEIISLEIPQKLQDLHIVADFTFEANTTNNFVLELNHVYNNIRIIFHYSKNWNRCKQNFKDAINEKDEIQDPKHIKLLLDALDANYNTITMTQANYDKQEDNTKDQQEQVQKESTRGTGNKEEEKDDKKIYHTINKYSQGIPLVESILINNTPYFIQINEDKEGNKAPVLYKKIELSDINLVPPERTEYLSKEYSFASFEEVQYFIDLAKQETLDSLFQQVKTILQKYIDIDDDFINILAADIIFTYFQDRLRMTHYLLIVGDNNTGKSNILLVFSFLAYRSILDTAITPANVYNYGSQLEDGQFTLIEDEIDDIDFQDEKKKLYKVSYRGGTKVTRMYDSNNSGPANNKRKSSRQQGFFLFCFKMFASEKMPDKVKSKGFLERIIPLKAIPGDPQYDISEVVDESGDEKLNRLYEELMNTRKLLLMYRLLHYNEAIPDIKLNIKNRYKQLTKPVLRLFQNTESVNQITQSLSKYLIEKNEEKINSLDSALLFLLLDLVGQKGTILYNNEIWDKVKEKYPGNEIEGKSYSYFSEEFNTTISKTKIHIICTTKFDAKDHKDEIKGRGLIFNPKKLNKLADNYSIINGLQIIPSSSFLPDTSDTSDTFTDNVDTNVKDSIMKNVDNLTDLTLDQKKRIPKNDHITTKIDTAIDTKTNRHFIKVSEPSGVSRNGKSGLFTNHLISESDLLIEDYEYDPEIINNIDRFEGSDRWFCNHCTMRDDKWFMMKHPCKNNINNKGGSKLI